MANAAFDTFKYVQTLTDSKAFTPEQAKILMQAQREAFEGGVATKEDIKDLKNEITRLEGKLDTTTAKLEGKLNLLYWMFGFLLTVNIAILIKLFL